ncbi:hypothetical protein MOQ_005062 [Trypanosoma cruzi marinkellei]|uniref:Mitochondrial RNA binding complex 1 subunit n=1 Tax=Trypanosoma cruzi marinkellei TaxID=85056 RepID=K2NQG6_TRYCR|nr:hypothetical protein MOQ_005062 [Trypanosoma cruzi marinkellei]
MRRILQPPTYGVSGLFAMAIKSVTGLRSGTGACFETRPMTLHVSVRAQGGFGGGGRPSRGQRGGGGGGNEGRGRGGGGGGGGGGGAARRTVINKTGDGELSGFTCVVMRDDSQILKSIVKHIPQNGAISVKSLHAQLSPDVQEAIAEKYDGLKNFLEQRKQLFVVKTNPADGVLYAAATPLALQKLVAREKQRETMQEMLGINSPDDSGKRGERGGRGGRGGNRGGGGGRGGGNRNNRGDGGGGGRGGGRGGFGGRGGGRGGFDGGDGGGGGRGGFGGRGGGRGGFDGGDGGGGGERFHRGRGGGDGGGRGGFDGGGGGRGGFRGRGNGGRMGGENRSFGTQGRR